MRFVTMLIFIFGIEAMEEQSRQIPGLKSLALTSVSTQVANHVAQIYDTPMSVDQLKTIITKQAKSTLERGAIAQLLIRSGYQEINSDGPSQKTLHNEHVLEIMDLPNSGNSCLYKRDDHGLHPLVTLDNKTIRQSFSKQATHGACEFYKAIGKNTLFMVFDLNDGTVLSSSELKHDKERIEQFLWNKDGRYLIVKKSIEHQTQSREPLHELQIYDLINKELCELVTVQQPLCSAQLSCDTNHCIIQQSKGYGKPWTVWWYNLSTHAIDQEITVDTHTVFASPHSRYGIRSILNKNKHELVIYDFHTNKKTILSGIQSGPIVSHLSHNGHLLLTKCVDQVLKKRYITVYRFDDVGVSPYRTIETPNDCLDNALMSWSPQDTHILCKSYNKWHLIDVESRQVIGIIDRNQHDTLTWKSAESGFMINIKDTSSVAKIEHFRIEDITHLFFMRDGNEEPFTT